MAEGHRNQKLRDTLRMLFRRRWLLLLAAALFAIVALLGSHRMPLEYSGTTKFERRSDPATERGMDRGSLSFETVKLTLNQELMGRKAIERVIDELGLAQGLPRDASGQLTSAGEQAKQGLVQGLQASTWIRWEVRSQNVDLVAVVVTHTNPELAQQIPDILVRNFIHLVGERERQRLSASRDFLQTQVRNADQRVREIVNRRIEFETQYAGMMPESPGALQVQIQRIQSDIDSLRRQYNIATQNLARLEAFRQSHAGVDGEPQQVIRGPNPELTRLEGMLRDAQDQLARALSQAFMTESHPTVHSLRARIVQLQEQIEHAPATVVLQTIHGRSSFDEVAVHIAAAQSDIQTTTAELDRMETRLAALEKLMVNFAPIRQEYLDIMDRLQKEETEANRWRQQLTQVQMALVAEVASRRTHLDAVEAAQRQFRPSTPKLRMVVGAALFGGLAFGGALVFLVNMLDRTLATPEDARTAFNIPILGIIGQITTRRQRMQRRFVRWLVGPTIGIIVLAALGGCLLSVVLWLRHPERYPEYRAAPLSFVQEMVVDRLSGRGGGV